MTKFITHVALYCQDLARTLEWYQSIFGMSIVAQAEGRFAAISFGEKHHDLALVQAPPEFSKPDPDQVGLYHISVDTGSLDNSMEIFDRFIANGGTAEKAFDHRVGIGIYIRDPDLNLVELWSETCGSYSEAIRKMDEFDPPFSENPIGWPFDVQGAHKAWKSALAGT